MAKPREGNAKYARNGFTRHSQISGGAARNTDSINSTRTRSKEREKAEKAAEKKRRREEQKQKINLRFENSP